MLKMYAKTELMMEMLREFTIREWKFDNGNTRQLWSLMSKGDRETFWFSLDKFDWTSYIKIYFYGIRKHILNEDLSNKEKALAKNKKYVGFLHVVKDAVDYLKLSHPVACVNNNAAPHCYLLCLLF